MRSSAPVNPIDHHVGRRVRQRRAAMGLCLDVLAQALALTPLQAEQIESGYRHLNVTKLYTLSRLLDVPVSYFFDELPHEYAAGFPGTVCTALPPSSGDQTLKRETLDLVRAFFAITDPGLRHQILELARQSANPSA